VAIQPAGWALDEYRKADPRSRLNPRATRKDAASRKGKPRFFCVQTSRQSLAYDFRIEHNGVLLSWAVPRGRRSIRRVKRLAMHVEDHPFRYGHLA
jgi:bifunctional non-homologous end joining protein LigD